MAKIPVPEGMFEIPDDAPVEALPHLGAGFALQAIMMSLGSPDFQPGYTAISTELMMKCLAMASAMLIAGDERFKTPRDLRAQAEAWGKMAAGFAKMLRDGEDATGISLFDELRLKQIDVSLN